MAEEILEVTEMPVIPKVKCRRCGATFSSLRSRCPNCGTRVVSQSTRTPGTTPGTVRGTAANSRAEANVRWQLAFGLVLVFAVILSVIVMVTSSLDGASGIIVSPSATPMPPISQTNQAPIVEAPPTPSPTPLPKVESIKILYMNTKDLTPENAWPTMRVGESISVNAVVYPMDITNPEVTWSCSAADGTSLQLVPAENAETINTVTLTCVSAESRSVDVTASCYGTSVTMRVYLREAS